MGRFECCGGTTDGPVDTVGANAIDDGPNKNVMTSERAMLVTILQIQKDDPKKRNSEPRRWPMPKDKKPHRRTRRLLR